MTATKIAAIIAALTVAASPAGPPSCDVTAGRQAPASVEDLRVTEFDPELARDLNRETLRGPFSPGEFGAVCAGAEVADYAPRTPRAKRQAQASCEDLQRGIEDAGWDK